MKRHIGKATLLGLLIAGLGVISPILWDKYKTKAGLELRHEAMVTLAEKTDALDKLQISYDSRPIPGVSKLVFSLLNFGRSPILQSELITPPQIRFTPPDVVLDAQIESSTPSNLGAVCTLEKPKGIVSISFPLMNPQDSVRFSVLVATANPNFDTSARIVGIKELTFVNLRAAQAAQVRRFPWAVLPVGFFTLLAWALVFLKAIPELIQEARVRRRLREGRLQLPTQSIPITYPTFVLSTFPYKLPQERKTLMDIAQSFTKQAGVNDEQHAAFLKNASSLAEARSATVPAFWFMLILGLIGSWFVLAKVL
jgi:hypothetical protein